MLDRKFHGINSTNSRQVLKYDRKYCWTDEQHKNEVSAYTCIFKMHNKVLFHTLAEDSRELWLAHFDWLKIVVNLFFPSTMAEDSSQLCLYCIG